MLAFRDHPLMNRNGVPSWPPIWTQTKRDSIKSVLGEVGILIYVYSNPPLSRKCFWVIEHEKEPYVGTLIFDDHAFCKQLSDLLRLNLNRSIKDIGDLDLSYAL